MPDYSVAEGGGPLPPFRESFLERLVAVNWGGSGAVFVSGDFCCFQRYARMEKKDSEQKWKALGSMAFDSGGGTFSSTYAKVGNLPTFVIGGHSGDSNATLMLSHDGLKWDHIDSFAGANSVDSLVWDADEKQFYLWLDSTTVFRSADGHSWSPSSTSFASHCKGILQGVADGVYGYDPARDTLIYPSGGTATIRSDASTVQAQESSLDVGLSECKCVAYTGGIWMAGGQIGIESGTTSSIDGGATWFVTTSKGLGSDGEPDNGYRVETIIGAPVQDFR